MGMMDRMMKMMMGRMGEDEKRQMMDRMMEKFFAGMTADDKQKMMAEMMPQMAAMMSGMMGGRPEGEDGGAPEASAGQPGVEMPLMSGMMAQMMPQCLNMMLPNMPREERVDFVLNMLTTLKEQGSAGMSDEEKRDFMAKVIERMTGPG